jgi:lipopolysaccharide export LptBFGC system permease protein LptF
MVYDIDQMIRATMLGAKMEPSIDQIIRWSLAFENASAQIQKAYDWRIAQWSAMATAILTAILAILSSTFLEYYKKTALAPHWGLWLSADIAVFLCAYTFCRYEIDRLRREFLALYTLLLVIK